MIADKAKFEVVHPGCKPDEKAQRQQIFKILLS